MEDFSAISVFVRVVEAKSFSAAAQQLEMTPSGVSRAIARLEEQIDAKLFFRSTRTLRLTDDGAAFYARCRDILADLSEAKEALGYSRTKPSGGLRIAVPTAIGRGALIPNFAKFEAQFPDIRIDMSMRDFPFDLNEEGFDCAIRMGALEDSDLIARKIGYFNNVLCASPDYLQQYGTPVSIEDLKKHRCINFVDPATRRPYQWQFDTPSGRVGVDIDAHMLINDGESVIQAAVAGLGIVQAPHCLAAIHLAQGLLQIVMTDTISTGSPLWVVYPQKRHLSARVQAFLEWVTELFSRTCEPMCRQAAERSRIEQAEQAQLAAVA
ncbi:LysR family transcriptional regulator [Pseudolysobacter antarcticus]|uniref:LysR family transcriptional regulator n=1 Tax=Pseudolysobacter antarcticus TaxID=2511995 RepID=A0A411HPG1_9GAMM|nr:LysR family transcriptional regulator [Pseudolysobacter antarcticus]QBB72375.1 LysR family transcriptional regulator [Pseudolysobacter antarcticus]